MPMKRIASLLLLLATIVSAQAASGFLRNWEVDLWDGICFPISSNNGGSTRAGYSLGFDFHYNFGKGPWNCGIAGQLDNANRRFYPAGADRYTQRNRTASFTLTGGYNFRRGSMVNPFITIGTGVGFHQIRKSDESYTRSASPVVIPKIGVELWRCVKICAYSQISGKSYNTVGLSIGLNIGGHS